MDRENIAGARGGPTGHPADGRPHLPLFEGKESMEQGAKATVFAQTIVNMGQGIAIATAVGVNTAAGRIQNDSDANKKKDTEQQKLKRIFDEQLAAVEKKWERKFSDFAESIAQQSEDL